MQILNCGHQNYEWGKSSTNSCIYKIQESNPIISSTLNPQAKYAELWIGTNKSLPSYLNECPKLSLSEYLQKNPKYLGKTIDNSHNGKEETEGCELSFLMKILSVGKTLSIQAHPDKDLAVMLHQTSPDIYKDSNYKPEMAIALSKFEALSNFAKPERIQENLLEYEEFKTLFSEDVLNSFFKSQNKESLMSLVTNLFQTPESIWKESLKKLIERLQKKEILTERDRVVLRLQEQFPLDIGIFFSLFMNYAVLSPGDCLVMRPNEPHAYLEGDCIECKIFY